jgi:hypothetical protein
MLEARISRSAAIVLHELRESQPLTYSRHAENKMRLYNLSEQDVERVVTEPKLMATDPNGMPFYFGTVRGALYAVVVALDRPGHVVTVYPPREGRRPEGL